MPVGCASRQCEQEVQTAVCVLHVQVYGRAVRIAASLGGFIARVGQDYALGQLDARMAVR